MDPIYYFIIGLLLVLSCFDLVVGVSNDAANFLNSAVGSKAAPRRTIILVAALGIIIGSLFSSGMMEIARSGVFMPAQFTFHDIMLIFLAVMLTDVILLDVFNTFGLPTSTTVSIVFELLGGAVAVALFKIWSGESGVAQDLASYINSSKALAIISGIFSSVFVAFICGISVMWISRLIFSFNYRKSFKYLGAVWCGVALTAITYFAVFKGLKGSTLFTKDMIRHLDAHIWLYVCYSFVFWTVLMAVLQNVCKVNILKIAVLAGTMALALSFAGNDLVNFIGVFMAGQSSMEIASAAVAQGMDLSTLTMGGLTAPVTADWRYLLGAGLIMVLALMFSKKARTVTDTEVNLARQGGGVERFGSVPPARMMVRYALNASRVVEKIMPASVGRFIEKRFQPVSEGPDNGASFDLIRASVNLTVAALLISLATSLKLPLSTTYVTFMVAMGSSLADKAWGRDSAVYRITGVITVISGWFFTAFAAFAMCCMVAACIVYGGVFGIITMCVLAAYLLLKSARLHRKRTQAAELVKGRNYADASSLSRYNEEIIELMKRMAEIYEMNLEALNVEDRKRLKKLRKESRGIRRSLGDKMAMEVMPVVQELRDGEADRGKRHVQMVEYATSVFESLSNITTASHAYIDNNHEGLDMEYIEDLRKMNNRVSSLYPRFRDMMETNDYSGLDECLDGIDALDEEFAEAVKRQIILRTENVSDMRRTLLYLNLLNETRTMIRKVLLLAKVQKKFVLGC
ncbi:anion permease [Akkermansia biwaensis]